MLWNQTAKPMDSSNTSAGQGKPVASGVPPVASSSKGTSAPTRPRRPWLLYGCGGLLALVLLLAATVAITIWYIQRPIKPVVLSEKEKAAVEAKLQRLGGRSAPVTTRGPGVTGTPDAEAGAPGGGNRTGSKPALEQRYVPGGKTLKLTEREVNGLLNANTDLGQSVRIEFETDAINAYLVVPIPKDFPVGGGKMFRARGRFRLSLDSGGTPLAMLDDVTVFGLSLPKAWLGGIKGENLLGQAVGGHNGKPVLKGIKSLRVEPGALVLEVED
jgi:hypothetical protein